MAVEERFPINTLQYEKRPSYIFAIGITGIPHANDFNTLMRFLPLVLFVAIVAGGCSSPDGDSASQVTYQCESGREIQASYPTDSTAVVAYDSQTLQMTIDVSASGARYVGDELEWWTKETGPGASGRLFRHKSDGTSGETVERCEQSDDSA